jgi:hypothetical protein
METNTVIGYRVQVSRGAFVTQYGDTVATEPHPCTISEAYARVSAYLAANPNSPVPFVNPVTRPLTPMETASKELGGLLTSLCERHGLNLGLSSAQIERQIAKELSDLGATGVGILSAARR